MKSQTQTYCTSEAIVFHLLRLIKRTLYVCLSKKGTVFLAKCQCKAGLGQACSHMAALLFKLESLKCNNISRIPEDITSTGKLQQWNVPAKREVQPCLLQTLLLQKCSMVRLPKCRVQHQ